MLSISVVMTAHNRRGQIINTLNSINYYNDGFLEVIVMDSTNDPAEAIDDLADKYRFPVIIKKKNIEWVNSCVAYNVGFNIAKGDIIIIQNAECMHVGNILQYAKGQSHDGLYITFGAYSFDFPLGVIDYPANREMLYHKVLNAKDTKLRGHSGWYNHTQYRPVAYHFCAAITRHDLEKINGFDERYGMGTAHDDCEILIRLKNAGIKIEIVNDPFVIHQWHKRTNSKMSDPLWQRNLFLYNEHTMKEGLAKAPTNKYYVR
jgi:glycosyltransferase involved in cell wall biosynthesis